MTNQKTIQVSDYTKSELDKLKVHPNQSYEEVIVKLINRVKLQTEMEKNLPKLPKNAREMQHG